MKKKIDKQDDNQLYFVVYSLENRPVKAYNGADCGIMIADCNTTIKASGFNYFYTSDESELIDAFNKLKAEKSRNHQSR